MPSRPAEPGARRPLGLFLVLMLGGVLLPMTLGSSATIFRDGDVSWHIATGRWILEHGAIPTTDPFSFTWAGKPWVPIEWLAEVAYAAAYDLAAYAGVAAVVSLALVALHLAVVLNALRHVGPLAAGATLVAMDMALIPMMLARPHLIAWALLGWWIWLMLRAREQGRAPPLLAALLMLAWANLHGSFVLGLGIAAVFALEALVESSDKLRVMRQWGMFGLACLAAVLLNANGIAGVVHPFTIANLEMLPLIDEWKPSTPAVTPWFFGVLAFALALVAWKGVRMHPVRALLLVGLAAMALLQVRHQAVFAIAAAMLLPPAFAARRTKAVGPLFESPAQRRLAAGAVAAAVVLLVSVRLAQPLQPPESPANPWKLIAAVPPELRDKPVLNGWSMGGPLILAGIRPYVDGRGDMYGDALVLDYKRITEGDAKRFEAAVRRWDLKWTILPHNKDKLIALLDDSPGWRRLYSNEAGVIHVRSHAGRR